MTDKRMPGPLTYYADSGTIVDDSRVVVLVNLYGGDADKLGPIMAAAPELLAALRMLSERYTFQADDADHVRRAIAKATKE